MNTLRITEPHSGIRSGLLALLVLACSGACATATAGEPAEHKRNASPGDGAGTACGASPLPNCPLQGWMRSQAAPAMKARDKVRLERAFTQIATFAPPDYPQWVKLSEAGAAAARRGDVDEAEVACSDCHDTYRARYRAERRDRPIF